MPTYEYECSQCKNQFEIFQNISDAPLKSCPKCGGAVRRLLGAGAAVIVRGSGSRTAGDPQGTSRCGRGRPCCGRDTPCERPPCDN